MVKLTENGNVTEQNRTDTEQVILARYIQNMNIITLTFLYVVHSLITITNVVEPKPVCNYFTHC